MNNRLYVGNLPFSVTSESLNDMFAVHGEVTEANMIMDRDSGRSKGFGFVEMATAEGATTAIEELNECELDGRTIKVNVAKEREARPQRSSGFSGGRR